MDLIERLRRVPLFQRLSEEHLRLLAEICEERTVPAGTVLCRQADLGATLFIVDRGEAIVHRVNEQGLRRPVGVIHAGEAFGLTSLFLGEPRDATVTALTEMHLWLIQRPAFAQLLAREPRLRRELLIPERILARLRAPRYPWLEPGELVIHHTRRHWVVFARSIAFLTFIVVAYLVLMSALQRATHALNLALQLLPVFFLYGLDLLWHWVDWRNEYFAVTTRRITHRERVALLYESRDEAPLDRIQNLNVQRGFWGSLFSYGTLTVQTAAQAGTMIFDFIPAPDKMAEAVFEQLDRARATRRAAERQLIREELGQHLNLETSAALAEMEAQGQPVDYVEEAAETPEIHPGKIVQVLTWMSQMGFLPQTRIETPDTVTWRKHWLFLIGDVITPLLLCLVMGVLTILALLGQFRFITSVFPYFTLITLFFALFGAGWFWWESTDWGNDLYIVTNERIIDMEKRPLFFAEQRREASLGVIQNVSLKIPNIIAGVFNFGDVVVQTAGAGEFTFDGVPNPREVQREIFRRMEAYREAQREKEAARRRAEMAEWFGVYDELRRQGQGQGETPPPTSP